MFMNISDVINNVINFMIETSVTLTGRFLIIIYYISGRYIVVR